MVEACTRAAKSYSLPSRLNPVPAYRGIPPRRAATSLHQLADDLSLGEKVAACTCSPRNSFSAGWYNLLPPWQGVIPRRAGTSRSPGATTSELGKAVCRRGFTEFFYQHPFLLCLLIIYFVLYSTYVCSQLRGWSAGVVSGCHYGLWRICCSRTSLKKKNHNQSHND
jgi:hypothetical protein